MDNGLLRCMSPSAMAALTYGTCTLAFTALQWRRQLFVAHQIQNETEACGEKKPKIWVYAAWVEGCVLGNGTMLSVTP